MIPLKGHPWRAAGLGYEDIYPDTWQIELKKAVDKKYCCITDLMDHVIEESEKIIGAQTCLISFTFFTTDYLCGGPNQHKIICVTVGITIAK